MKIVKKFSDLFRCKWGENYDKKEKDKDVLLILVIVHVWVLLILGLLAQERLRKFEEDEFGKVEYGSSAIKKVYGKIIRKVKCSVSKGYDCVVTCKDLDLNKQDDVDALYDALENAKEVEACKLKLDSATFHDFKLYENWITLDPAKHVNITQLEISEGQLIDITYNSFACLPQLKTLTIYKTGITELAKNSFINMPELITLELRNNPNLTNVEIGFLQNFKLSTLQIQDLPIIGDSAVEFLGNLTGEKNYRSLSSLDLSYNNIGYFPKKLLSYYSSSLVQLIITASNVTEFENGSFSMIPKNGKIVVDRNQLEKFPEDEYRSVVENIGTLYVKDNKLVCDCDMQWLQTFVIEEKDGDFGDFSTTKCDEPKDVPFLEADMCSGTTGTTSSTTEKLTTPPTEPTTNEPCDNTGDTTNPPISPTEPPDIQINCESYENKRSRRSISLSKFRISKRDEITLHLSPRAEDLHLKEDDDGTLNIKFDNTETVKSLLYWKDDDYGEIRESDIECVTDIRKSNISISKIAEDANYVFCLFNASNAQINILNCKAFKSDPSYSNKTWLPNKMQATAITAVTASALVFIIIGALVFYLIVRKNPSLIRGSERVIVVKRHNKAQFMVLPRGHSDSTITGSSKYALSDSMEEPSISGDSISTVSYISAIQPTPLEIFRYRVQRLQALTWGNQNERDEDGDKTPPPLPPYPIRIYQPECNARLPPNVDLLFEYEWYTTTTMTTTS